MKRLFLSLFLLCLVGCNVSNITPNKTCHCLGCDTDVKLLYYQNEMAFYECEECGGIMIYHYHNTAWDSGWKLYKYSPYGFKY